MSLPKYDASLSECDAPAPRGMRKAWNDARFTFRTFINHMKRTGVGLVCAVGYFDPGNWGVDLQAGSQYGYKLLFIVLLSGIFATFLQILAARLGIVTGRDLASHCRLLLHDRPKHKMLYRWVLFYPLYFLSESAIIATDLAELIGSATALCLLFPALPLWAGVLITACDVLALLTIRDPLGRRPVRLFECVIAGMVFTVVICMAIIISRVGVDWGDAFFGFVPSSTVVQSGALYTSIGIIGATVMPHGIFLGSHLATQDRLGMEFTRSDSTFSDVAPTAAQTWRARIFGHIVYNCRTAFRILPATHYANAAKTHAEHENPPYEFVRAHLYHGMIDIAVNLLGIAVAVNALIVILASAVFYYGVGHGTGGPASLFDAYDLLNNILGKAVATLFALALLASGQSSSIIDTMAGQTVAEGFLQWRLSPVMRRLFTRSFGLVPSMIVAVAIGKKGVDAMLVASQVVLSIVLPFIVFPLLYLTDRRDVMSVRRPREAAAELEEDTEKDEDTEKSAGKDVGGDKDADGLDGADDLPRCSADLGVPVDALPKAPIAALDTVTDADVEAAEDDDMVCYANHWVVSVFGWALWVVVVAANVYAIVSLGMGTSISS